MFTLDSSFRAEIGATASGGRAKTRRKLDEPTLQILLLLLDSFCLWLAFQAAYLLRYKALLGGPPDSTPDSLPELFWATPFVTGAVFLYLGLYRIRVARRYSEVFFHVMIGIGLSMAFFLTVSYALKAYYSRLMLGYFGILAVLFVFLGRILWKHFILAARTRKLFIRRVAIVGDSPVGDELCDKIRMHPELGYEVVGMLVAGDFQNGDSGRTAPLNQASGTGDVLEMLRDEGVEELVFTITPKARFEFLELVGLCQTAGIAVRLLPDLYEIYSTGMRIDEIEGIPLIHLKEPNLSEWETLAKRLLDIALATLILMALAPLYLVLMAVLRVAGCNPVLEKREKAGLMGASVTLTRFRLASCQKNPACPACGLCKLLDRYSFGDIPELVNVIRGDISLVGPRPEPLDKVARYSEWNRRRLLVRPGLTGLAQINGLRGFSGTDEKTQFDMLYVQKRSLLFDLLILAQTPITLLRRQAKSKV